MKKARKIHTQGTDKEENRSNNIKPDSGADSRADDTQNAGVSSQIPGDRINEGNQVLADISLGGADKDTDDGYTNNNTTNNYTQEVDVNAGGVAVEKSPGATNIGDNPSNTDLAATPPDDRETLSRWVDEDAEKQTGRPTGAIYGSGGEIISASEPTPRKKATQKAAGGSTKKRTATNQSATISRMYGQLHKEENSFLLKAANVPGGQLQLLASKEMEDQLAKYNGQLVSVTGELSKKNKADKYTTFSIHKIVSHDQIGQRAYELSQQNPDAHEENWLLAENELLRS